MRVLRSPVDAWPGIRKSLGGEPWDILQMLCFGDAAVGLLTCKDAPLWVPWRSGLWSTAAYIINQGGMRKVSTRTRLVHHDHMQC